MRKTIILFEIPRRFNMGLVGSFLAILVSLPSVILIILCKYNPLYFKLTC